MLELIVDDLLLLDKLKRDHAADLETIKAFELSITQRMGALKECEKAIVLEKTATAQEAGKLALEKEAHKKTKKKLAGQKLLKWTGWGLATYLAIRGATN